MLHTHRDDASKRRQLRSVTVAVTTSRIVTELFFFGVPSFTEFFFVRVPATEGFLL